MTDTLTIERETHDLHGRYVVRMPSGEEAEMTWGVRGPGIRDFNHTYVPDAFRGSGVAAQLMARAIEDARGEGFKIIPSCSYVAAQFRRHSDWADLLA
jgi:uncharacterized protein